MTEEDDKMILFINACVREESRTKRLADCLLSKMEGKVEEFRRGGGFLHSGSDPLHRGDCK